MANDEKTEISDKESEVYKQFKDTFKLYRQARHDILEGIKTNQYYKANTDIY